MSTLGSEPNLAQRIEQNLLLTRTDTIATYLERGERIGEQLDGATFRERVLHLAAHLEQRLPEGSRVLLVIPPSLDCTLALVACLYAGVIAAPLPVPVANAHRERLDAVIADADASAVLCTRESAQVLLQQYDGERRSLLPTLLDLDALAEAPLPLGGHCRGLARAFDDDILVQYTSGSTRQPRGVRLSGRNVVSNAALASERWRLGAHTVSVNWLPNYHDMGMMGGTLCPLLWGAPCIQLSPLAFAQKPLRWLRAISQFGATLSGGPAFAFALCVDAIAESDLDGLDLSSWQVAFCGAEPVPAGLLPRFRARLARAGLDPAAVHACYGLAESTLYVAGERAWDGASMSLAGDGRTEPNRLAPSTRATLRIVDPASGQAVADGEEGEIWVAGPSVSAGYLNQPEESRATFGARLEDDPRAFMRTGDLGTLNGDTLSVTGRLKDVLIAQGRNTAAVDLEWLAADLHPALNPMAAAAFQLASDDPRVALLIELRGGQAAPDDAQQLAEAIRARIGATFGLDLAWMRVVKRGSLERTTSGKVRRQTVAARVRAGHHYPDAREVAP
ncbi:fatty acyl-AMP ligase [Pseudomonas mangiferae]|uniref:Fatty acyl-AMP ligase n=1 Tax=Pseudomonas mangiferae TaxID=2593654 RepID=A0A553H0D3_9PSED|nr:fatty acyl-AMP ligase [Pseudomonas mangiferae]TRX75187.1 fatty acyl-AMP ligase [Pseudomonas mangiferae]